MNSILFTAKNSGTSLDEIWKITSTCTDLLREQWPPLYSEHVNTCAHTYTRRDTYKILVTNSDKQSTVTYQTVVSPSADKTDIPSWFVLQLSVSVNVLNREGAENFNTFFNVCLSPSSHTVTIRPIPQVCKKELRKWRFSQPLRKLSP